MSKVLPENARGAARSPPASGRSAASKTDRLDCYLLHWRGRHPLADTIAGFEELAHGKILSWGVSNFDAADLDEALARSPATAHRLQPGALPPGGARHRARRPPVVRGARGRGRRLQPVRPWQLPEPVHGEAGACWPRSPRRTARRRARWRSRFLARRTVAVRHSEGVGRRHVAENAGAGDLRLTAAEVARIDSAFRAARARGLAMIRPARRPLKQKSKSQPSSACSTCSR